MASNSDAGAFDLTRTGGRCRDAHKVPPLNLQSHARFLMNALEYTAVNRSQLLSLVIEIPVIGEIKKVGGARGSQQPISQSTSPIAATRRPRLPR